MVSSKTQQMFMSNAILGNDMFAWNQDMCEALQKLSPEGPGWANKFCLLSMRREECTFDE